MIYAVWMYYLNGLADDFPIAGNLLIKGRQDKI